MGRILKKQGLVQVTRILKGQSVPEKENSRGQGRKSHGQSLPEDGSTFPVNKMFSGSWRFQGVCVCACLSVSLSDPPAG